MPAPSPSAAEGTTGLRLVAPPLVFEPRDTLFSALVGAARRHGRHAKGLWRDAQGTYGYGDLIKISLALGRLACKVSQPGEHVGVMLPNIVPAVGLLLGLSAFGRVPCMLNYSAGGEVMRNACVAAGIRTVVTSRKFVEKAGLEAAVAALGEARVLYIEDLRRQFGLLDKLWLMAYALRVPLRAVPKGDPEDVAVVLFTSGTEGKPKGVALSHRALLANVAQVTQVLHFSPQDDHVLTSLPIFHSFGLTVGTLIPMVIGARVTLYVSPLHFKEIPRLVREQGCTVLFSCATFLQQYARAALPEDFKSLRLVVAGAEKLAEPIRALWRERFGIDIIEGYGATETAPVLAANLIERNRPGTVGPLLPGIEARIVPVPGIEGGGELHVRGPNLMSGYYRFSDPGRLEPPASSLGSGWYDTGDVVALDAEGCLRIVGRLKRFAKIGGEMVSLDMAEAIASAAEPEAQHAAIAVPHPGRGEAIHLFTTGVALTRERLVAAAHRLGCPEIAVPREVDVLDNLPILASGKVDYLALHAKGSGL